MAVTKISEKFTEKKSKFNTYIDQPELFDCGDISVIKLFQYAIFRENGFGAKSFWKYPFFLINLIFFIKRLRIKKRVKLHKNTNCKVLVGDIHRCVMDNDGNYKSRYFTNILSFLKSLKINYLFLNTTQIASECKHDISISELYPYYSVLPLNNDDKVFLKNVRRCFKNIIQTLNLSDDKIKIFEEIIQIFWQEYRTYRFLLTHYPDIQLAFLFPHYQKESLIYALRKKGIKIIELQHGLIAEEDMFYIYDKKILPVKDKALFADEMWVYGEYWKNILLKGYEYNPNQIKVFGYYLYYKKEYSAEFKQFIASIRQQYSTIILVTLQKNMEHYFAEYIHFLLKDAQQKKQSVVVIIKPHPSATQDITQFLDTHFSNAIVVNYPTEWLLQNCDIHFSIYSTTLFDALMFNIKHNYALKHPLFSDYVEGIVKQGIAKELLLEENIIDKINLNINNTEEQHLNPRYLYADVNWNDLTNLIKDKNLQ